MDIAKMRGMMQEMRAMMDRMEAMMDVGMDEDGADMQTMRAMNVDMSDPKARAVYAREKRMMK